MIRLIQFTSRFCYLNTLLYGFIFGYYYWTLFFLNEFNSHCVPKLPNVSISNIMIITLKLYSYLSYTLLLFVTEDLTVYFHSIFLQVINVNATYISLKINGAPRSCLCVVMVTSNF